MFLVVSTALCGLIDAPIWQEVCNVFHPTTSPAQEITLRTKSERINSIVAIGFGNSACAEGMRWAFVPLWPTATVGAHAVRSLESAG